MTEWWVLTAAANAILVLVYGALAVYMVQGLVRGRQWATNPLATATAAIFVTCTIGHAVHLEHALLPWYGPLVGIAVASSDSLAMAAQTAFSDPRLIAWDMFTAAIAIWYFTMRSRLAIVFGGAALCEDMAKREAEAMELHDNIVQGLVKAKLSLDMGRREEGARAVEETLTASKHIISGLLGRADPELAMGAGDLRREAPGR